MLSESFLSCRFFFTLLLLPPVNSPLKPYTLFIILNSAGVKLTQMNTFIEKEEYQQLLFAALGSLPGLELIRSDANIELLPPAIRKPKELWTGKQVSLLY